MTAEYADYDGANVREVTEEEAAALVAEHGGGRPGTVGLSLSFRPPCGPLIPFYDAAEEMMSALGYLPERDSSWAWVQEAGDFEGDQNRLAMSRRFALAEGQA
jgi:hypothetical protein